MTLADLMQLTLLKLGEQTAFFTPEEIVQNGLDPAQRLLCLAHPPLYRPRATLVVESDQPFVDLRTLLDSDDLIMGNRIRRVVRVVLGDVSGDIPVESVATGEYRDLTLTTVQRLGSTNGWLSQHGEITKFWLWGKIWLGLYKRPIDTLTLTIVFDAAPPPFDINVPTQEPVIQASFHPLIAEIAAGLLLTKEGQVEGERGLQRITQALGLQQ